MSLFTTCIITVPSKEIAEQFEICISHRKEHGLYPSEISFFVCPDPTLQVSDQDPEGADCDRLSKSLVGNGGATLLALHKYIQSEKWNGTDEDFFRNRRILIIHAGGSNDRIPCYGPENKLFIPLPIDSSSIIPPVVLDKHISLFLKYPWNPGEVVVMSGDVICDFAMESIPHDRGDICGFAAPETLMFGSKHGVFQFDKFRKNVVDYFQKASVDTLNRTALLEGTTHCAVDTGIISMSPAAVTALLKAGKSDSSGMKVLTALEDNVTGFSIYNEVVLASLSNSTLDNYLGRIESKTLLSNPVRNDFYNIFSKFTLQALLIKPSYFLSLSTIPDYLKICSTLLENESKLFYSNDYEELKVQRSSDKIVFNSKACSIPLGKRQSVIAEGVESSMFENVLGSNLLVGIHALSTDAVIPEGICIDQRHYLDSTITAVYHCDDTFVDTDSIDKITFCGIPLTIWMKQRSIEANDLWTSSCKKTFYNAQLFCSEVDADFIPGYWQPTQNDWGQAFRRNKRFTLAQLSQLELSVREDIRVDIRRRLLGEQIVNGKGWISASENDFLRALDGIDSKEKFKEIYAHTDDERVKSYRRVLLKSAGILFDNESNQSTQLYVGNSKMPFQKAIRDSEKVFVSCPVRMDVAGGWSDFPPYCTQYGGAVVNCAIDLQAGVPINVSCHGIPENKIIIKSVDSSEHEIIETFEELLSLQKANRLWKATLAKILPEGESLSSILTQAGGGLQISIGCNLPHGSGLGVSSLIASSLYACVNRYYGRVLTGGQIVSDMLDIENKLTGGSGWQDLTGGIFGGVKFCSSDSALIQKPEIFYLDPYLFTNKSHLECITLFYTGQTTSVGSVVQKVRDKMHANVPSYRFTIDMIKELALSARDSISKHDQMALSEILNGVNFENSLVFESESNDFVSQLLKNCAHLYRGVKMLGSGNSYALFISDTVGDALRLKEYLTRNTESTSKVMEFEINSNGLTVDFK